MVLVNTILKGVLDLHIYRAFLAEAPKEKFSRMGMRPDILNIVAS